MAEVTTLSHLAGMQSGRSGELRGQSQRAETVLVSEQVDVREDILLERTHGTCRALPDRACWCRTGPEPQGEEGQCKTKERTPGHVLWIGLILWPRPPLNEGSGCPGRLLPAAMPQPIDEDHLERARDRNRGERTEHPCELGADEHCDEHHEGRELDGLSVDDGL